MAAITNLSDLINRMTGGASGTPEPLWFFKLNRRGGAAAANSVPGRWTSMWTYDGSPSGGAVPGAVAIPDNTTIGGLKQTDPGGGRQKWLIGGGLNSGPGFGTYVLYDRLLHIGGLDATVTTTQAVGGSLTRYTNGVGNIIFLEIYTQIGATSRTIVVNYTDEGGGAGASPAIVFGNTGFREAERLLAVPLASGDSGVQGVTDVDIDTTTGTAGNFGVTIAHPLAYYEISLSSGGVWRSFMDGHGIVEVLPDACLALAYCSSTAATSEVYGNLSMVEA